MMVGPEQARERLQVFLAYQVQFVAPADLYERSLLLADAQNLRAVYDAQYLALAEIEGCECWTADDRLLRSLQFGRPTVLDSYAGTSPAEFLAVGSEVFFCRPEALRQQSPRLYELLQLAYQQNPAEWGSPT